MRARVQGYSRAHPRGARISWDESEGHATHGYVDQLINLIAAQNFVPRSGELKSAMLRATWLGWASAIAKHEQILDFQIAFRFRGF